MDAPRSNSPSRKSRFRAQSTAVYRPASPSNEPPAEGVDPVLETAAPTTAAEAMPALAAGPVAESYAPEEVPEVPADAPPVEDDLPAGLRLTRTTPAPYARRGFPGWVVGTGALLCLLLGGAGGYLCSPKFTAASPSSTRGPNVDPSAALPPLTPAVLADVDAAFEATKKAQFSEARRRFEVLGDKNPAWVSMRVEAARAALYAHDFESTASILKAAQRGGPNVDAIFLTGLLDMTKQVYDKAEADFARAVALDPSRADIFYFWGECLRREGKLRDATGRFQEALIRNQYETTEGLYQLKLWLSQIQSNGDAAAESSAKIDANLASSHPSGTAMLAAAARDIQAGQYKQAAEHIGQAQKVTEPVVFRVILQDPTFLQENFRPEIAPFYKP